MEKDIYIFAIESSCDETSCSIIKNGKVDISTVILTQIDIHTNFGGVVPEIASRQHVKNITMVMEECLSKANMTMNQMDAVAVTYGPGLIGSLLVGLEAAKTLSFIYHKPLIAVHHIRGHIFANALEQDLKFPLLSLVVSGGHTEFIYMKNEFEFEKLGGTLDDAIGECYDKVARVLNLPYPGGPKIDSLAKIGKPTYHLPTPLDDGSYNFSFSGLKSAVINLVHNETQRNQSINQEDLACSFQTTVVDIIAKKTEKALQEKKVKMLLVAGGVAANHGIRTRLQEVCEKNGITFVCPSIKYCTDNAAMIGAAAYALYKQKRFATIELNAASTDCFN